MGWVINLSQAVLSYKSSIVFKVVHDQKQVVLFNAQDDDSNILKIEGVAGLFWLSIDGQLSVEEIIDKISQDLKGKMSPEKIREGALLFAQKIIDLNLVNH